MRCTGLSGGSPIRLRFYTLGLAMAWTLVLGGLSAWELRQHRHYLLEGARCSARAAFEENLLFRRWGAMHGGVYVPITEKTPPNPHLGDVPERDITTPSGRRLTLINPASMLRQMHELAADQLGMREHVTSLKPLRPENAPDGWEEASLKQFEGGSAEVDEVVMQDGQPYLRLMRPMIAEPGCLKCHASQGYEAGDVRGGISVAVPLAPIYQAGHGHIRGVIASYAFLWALGLCGIVLGARRLNHQIDQRYQVEQQLRQARESLESAVEQRTAELRNANEGLRREAGERLQAEEASRREYAKLEAMISGMQEGVVFADAGDRIVELNDYFCRFVGKGREEILGRRIEDLHLGAAAQRIMRQIAQFREAIGSQPWVLQRPLAGAEVVLRMQPIYRDGNYDGVLLNVIDVSELVRARQQAEVATEAKSRFLATMSHEIRTPMTAILGYTDLLADPALAPADRATYLAVIRRNGEHLLQLINDILDLSKIEAGKLTLEIRPCSVVSLIADVASMMRLRADQRQNVLGVEYAGALPETILTDGSRLRQALVNLVGNAVKFTQRGSVRITASLAPQWRSGQPAVKIEVIDTGIGIPAEVLPQLFRPFTQADSATSREYGGTGLGLTITRHIAEMLGGELTVQSAAGQGSTFTLTVPTGDLSGVAMLPRPGEAIQESPADASHQATGSPLGGVRVLLAEDGIDNQELIRTVLCQAGAEVEVADNGRQAVAKAQAGRFDLILMDINMPEMDGCEATRLLRSQGYDRPILALTANAMSADGQRSREAGCNEHLTKPIDRTRLIGAIARYAAKPTAAASEDAPPAQPADAGDSEVIASLCADDPEIAPILDGFVERLPGQVAAMEEALAAGNYDDLQRLAHRLKGSGGNYGYPCLTDAARLLEDAVRLPDPQVARLALQRVESLCRAIQQGHQLHATVGKGSP